METLRKIIDAIIAFLKYKTAKQENIKVNKETANIIEQDAKKIAEKKQKEVNEAIESKDEDKINSIINRVCKKGMIIFILAFQVLISGCYTEYVPVYVPESDKVIYMEHEDKPGYWVPERTMNLLLSYKVKYEAYVEAIDNAKKSK